MFPNPASEYIILELSREAAHQQFRAVELSDSSGKRVWRETLSAQLGVRIPLAGLALGVYGCRVVLEGGEVLSGRFVVGRGR
jgi:aspartate oxidase